MSDFSKTWKNSKQPRKQRKYVYNAPLHTRQKFMTAMLSKDLAKKHGISKLPVRKGDKVKIMRGQFSGKAGKINRISLADSKLYVEGIDRTKIDGSKANYPFVPSNVMITEINTEDRRRLKGASKNEKQA